MKKNYTVYKHIAPNGKRYVGQTGSKNPNRRWMNGIGYRNNLHFYSAIQKYGWDNFEHVIVADGLTKQEADYLEKYLIAFYETTKRTKGYNHTNGGEKGYTMTEEIRHKMSEKATARNIAQGDYTGSKIAEVFDVTKTIDENLEVLKENGTIISKSQLYRWAKKNNIETVDSRDKGIATGYNPELTLKENQKAMGCSYRQVIKARDEYNKRNK